MVATLNYLGISSRLLIEEAEIQGLQIEVISKSKNLFYIRGNGKEILFKSTDFGANSALGYKIADDKEVTYKLLEKHNVPIAKSIYVDALTNLNEELLKKGLSFPLIIKPIDEGHGNGVKMNILDVNELKNKLEISLKKYGSMIIQEQIEGDEFRVIVFGDNILIVMNRVPAHIIGDGKLTINELVEIENKNPLRGEGYDKPLSFIKIDSELKSFIKKQSLNIISIIGKGKKVYLRGNSNIGTGGFPVNFTDKICDEVKKDCIESAKVCGLGFCGVDVITTDISKPLSETGGIILELNATPGLGGHKSIGINTAKLILEKLFN